MRVVLRKTVAGDIDRCLDNLRGSHHPSHVNCVLSVYSIDVSGQLSRDVIGCFKHMYVDQHVGRISNIILTGKFFSTVNMLTSFVALFSVITPL